MDLTVERVIERGKKQIGKTAYKLGEGGRDPSKPYCGTKRNADGKYLCDCSGFTAFSFEHDRYQPNWPYENKWLSTTTIHTDARTGQLWHQKLSEPRVGALIVYPSVTSDGRRRIGHIGIIVGLGTYATQGIKGLDVMHCSAKYNGVCITKATAWHGKGVFNGKKNDNWASLFVWPTWRLPL